MASAFEMWLENAIYHEVVNSKTKAEVLKMIDELVKTKVSQMVAHYRAGVKAETKWRTCNEEE